MTDSLKLMSRFIVKGAFYGAPVCAFIFYCYSISFSALRRTVHITNIIVNRFELALRKRICELIKQEYKSISYCGNQCADFEYSLAYAVDISGV